MLAVMLGGAFAMSDAPAPERSPSVPAAAYMLLDAPDRRIRAPQPRVHALLGEGFRHSRTFAALVTALGASDVIVYVETVMTLPKGTMGRITMASASRENRYLRIQIRADLPRKEAIALIAHEMRHALEIAEAVTVRDHGALIQLYERIGHSSGGSHAYDTAAAQEAGRQVRRELVGPI
jgi:hypothetical protein